MKREAITIEDAQVYDWEWRHKGMTGQFRVWFRWDERDDEDEPEAYSAELEEAWTEQGNQVQLMPSEAREMERSFLEWFKTDCPDLQELAGEAWRRA